MRNILSFIYIIGISIIGLPSHLSGQNWEIYRGRTDLTGLTNATLPEYPVLLWNLKTDSRTVSSPVISAGSIYFGNNDGDLYAVSS